MNSVISDTAEYGCYLYDHACRPLLSDFMETVETDVIGQKYNQSGSTKVDNRELNAVNEAVRSHPVEVVGKELRGYMTAMESIAVGEEGATETTDTVRNFNQWENEMKVKVEAGVLCCHWRRRCCEKVLV